MNENMDEISTSGERTLSVKILAIIGFCATVAIIVWLVMLGIKYAPSAFSSLAGIAESINTYQPLDKIEITTEKTVANSGESFTISWTDVHQTGIYEFSYACTEGMSVEVHEHDGSLVSLDCTDVLALPATLRDVEMTITSKKARFADATLNIVFTNDDTKSILEDSMKITVVNASIPVGGVTPHDTPSTPSVPEPAKPTTPVVTPAPQPATPVYTTVYPQSNPHGYVDLKVTTLGNGTLVNGVMVFTATFDRDAQSAVKFDIKNIGTKTSDTWTFKTTLPSGVVYESKPQVALKPMEHVEFTLGFYLGDENDDLVEIKTRVYTDEDTNAKNDSSVWSVVVTD